MFCQHCGTKIEEDELFCPKCGGKVEREEANAVQQPEKVADAELPNQEEQNADAEQNLNVQLNPQYNMAPQMPPQKKKMGGFAIFMIFMLIAAIIVGIIGFSVWRFIKKASEPMDIAERALDKYAEEEYFDEQFKDEEPAKEKNAVDLSAVDVDAVNNGECILIGQLKEAADDEWILTWSKGISIYTYDENADEVIMKDVKSAYVEDYMLEDDVLETARKEKEVSIEGYVYASGKSVYIDAYTVLDKKGNEVKAKKDGMLDEDGYVIKDSDVRLLTNADVSGLSLQEINYAKNEIYARHGRKFDSPELRNYFNGKSWYYGTINPADFSEGLLSDVEKKNAEFLSSVEFSMSAGGYKLDAN